MVAFLSEEWFAGVNARLAATPGAPLESGAPSQHIVIECTDAPAGADALTLTLSAEGATVTAGDHLAAETILRLSYRDALAISDGTLTSADALRDGRIKVRGDVSSLLRHAGWLAAVFATTN